MSRAYYVIDVFTAKPFAGNPAAVVLDTQGLSDAQMQAIAAEFNLSETTFVLPAGEDRPGSNEGNATGSLRFRWFAPAAEVDMCGHATIAGLHALAEAGRITDPPSAEEATVVHIETRGGRLTGFVERVPGPDGGRMYWLELVPPRLSDYSRRNDGLAAVLGVSSDAFDPSLPPVQTQDLDLIAFVRDFQTLYGIAPDFPRLGAWLSDRGLRGLSLATTRTITPSVHVQSRFFAPHYGINEDPVTGSVHGPLAAHLVAREAVPVDGEMAGLTCVQGEPGGRTGLINALVAVGPDGAHTVRIGGQAVTVMHGTLFEA